LQVAAEVLGLTVTTVLGVLMFIFAGLHDVVYDCVIWMKESMEDGITARVGGPAYFGWPVHGAPGTYYQDNLSWRHAQGEGMTAMELLGGHFARGCRRLASLLRLSSFKLSLDRSAAAGGAAAACDGMLVFRRLAASLHAQGVSAHVSGEHVSGAHAVPGAHAPQGALAHGQGALLHGAPLTDASPAASGGGQRMGERDGMGGAGANAYSRQDVLTACAALRWSSEKFSKVSCLSLGRGMCVGADVSECLI